MFTPLENCVLYDALKGITLESAWLSREITPQEWVCYSGDYILVVRYQQGCLGLGVGETECEAYGQMVILANDDIRFYDCVETPIAFSEVLAFLGWAIDEDRCGDLNAGQLPLKQHMSAVPVTQTITENNDSQSTGICNLPK